MQPWLPAVALWTGQPAFHTMPYLITKPNDAYFPRKIPPSPSPRAPLRIHVREACSMGNEAQRSLLPTQNSTIPTERRPRGVFDGWVAPRAFTSPHFFFRFSRSYVQYSTYTFSISRCFLCLSLRAIYCASSRVRICGRTRDVCANLRCFLETQDRC